MPQSKHSAVYLLASFAFLLFCTPGFAQTQRSPSRQTVQVAQRHANSSPAAARTAPRAKPSPVIPATAPSLLSDPAAPARVSLASGKLSVQANNSSLSDILRQVARAGGMKIDGLQTGGSADQRIFGSYGPGAPRDVLSDLLHGSRYNVLMMGNTPSGTPRELALSLRTGGVPNPPPHPPTAEQQQEENGDDVQPPTTEDQDTEPGVPPAGVQENEPVPPPPGDQQNRVRTPQQILQELQRMHQQQRPQ